MVDKAEGIEREAAQIANNLYRKGLEDKVEALPDELRDRVKRILRGLERAGTKSGQPGDPAFERARMKRKFALRNI